MNLGTKQSGNDNNVHLRPLTDNLKMLWETNVDVFVVYSEDNFCLDAMLFWIINYFPTHGNLSGEELFLMLYKWKKTLVILNWIIEKIFYTLGIKVLYS